MLMKSSISFLKKTLFPESVSSASINSACRRIESGDRRFRAANRFPSLFSPTSSVYQPHGIFGESRGAGSVFALCVLSFISGEFLPWQMALGRLALSRGNFFQNSPSDFLQFPEPRQIVLKIVAQELRVLRPQLGPQNHVPQFYGMRKQRLFLQFLERNLGVLVIHA